MCRKNIYYSIPIQQNEIKNVKIKICRAAPYRKMRVFRSWVLRSPGLQLVGFQVLRSWVLRFRVPMSSLLLLRLVLSFVRGRSAIVGGKKFEAFGIKVWVRLVGGVRRRRVAVEDSLEYDSPRDQDNIMNRLVKVIFWSDKNMEIILHRPFAPPVAPRDRVAP
jgi:hypothetical protein